MAKTLKTLLGGAAVLAGACGLAAWAVAPRSERKRSAQGVAGVPQVYYAHRGLHDAGTGLTKRYAATSGEYVRRVRELVEAAGWASADSPYCTAPENTLPAFAAACEAGYGIELDIQLSADGQVVVVHDGELKRVANDERCVQDLTYEELRKVVLYQACRPGVAKASQVEGSDSEAPLHPTGAHAAEGALHEDDASYRAKHFAAVAVDSADDVPGKYIPLFSEVLQLVDGRVPLIIEFKFANNARWGAAERELMEKGAALLDAYDGAYMVESFHPGAVAWYKRHRPQVCRGQLAEWPARGRGGVPEYAAGALALNELARPDFVAYQWRGGKLPQVRAARLLGAQAVSWTPRSQQELDQAKQYFDCHIFESFIPR